jgi:hypothetical protein
MVISGTRQPEEIGMKQLRGACESVLTKNDSLTQHLTMHFCGFCGKGPFPTSSGLNKHIRHSVNCNKAARKKFGSYATNIWDDSDAGPSNVEPQPPASPPTIPEGEVLPPEMPDITLEEDLQGFEGDFANSESMGAEPNPITPEASETHPA